MTFVAVFVGLVFLYSLVSGRLERTVITAPILFTTAGLLLQPIAGELHLPEGSVSLFLLVAEVGLVLLLFTDASRTDLGLLRASGSLSARLLGIGMLPTILLGAVAARAVFPALSLWEAGILGAILAPTDAGLGQVVVSSPRVPARIREALNVEAGLNDGLSVPFLLFFLALVVARTEGSGTGLSQFVVQQLGYGALIGAGIGLAGGWLLASADRHGWMSSPMQQLGVVCLPLLGLLASEAAGASMFIAAFVAGLAVQVRFGEAGRHSIEFAESWGQLLNLSVFFLFGLLVAREAGLRDARLVLYAVLSLTVVRMLPVALALVGAGLSRASVIFMGWFGPRGLASIVLGLVYLEQETHTPGEPTIRLAVMMTVLLSIFAHGLSAKPGIDRYAAKVSALGPGAPEHQDPA